MNDSTSKEGKIEEDLSTFKVIDEMAECSAAKNVEQNSEHSPVKDKNVENSPTSSEYASVEVQKNYVGPPMIELIGDYKGVDLIQRTMQDKLYDCNFDWDKFEENSESVTSSDEWQDLTKSDYAKVIFCDLYYHTLSGRVECKFQITDNVHEDPCDYVGLFRVGYDSLSQCLVSKMLSETECEEDGKLLRCVFAPEELPEIKDGYYQFLYVTRDKEICGASMPFEIKQARYKNRPLDDEVVTEKTDDDFLLVRTGLEKKNNLLEELLAETQERNRQLNSTVQTLVDEKNNDVKEKEIIIDSLHQEILASKQEIAAKASAVAERDNTISTLSTKIASLSLEISLKDSTIREKDNSICSKNQQIENHSQLIKKMNREKQNLTNQLMKLENSIKERDVTLSAIDQDKLTLLEQLEDQKFMIKALEDSKQLALKEMNDLSESLSKRAKMLNQTRNELSSCKEAFLESTKTLEEHTKVLDQTKAELAACKKNLQESYRALSERTNEIFNVKAELSVNEDKLQLAVNNIEECQRVLTPMIQKANCHVKSYTSFSTSELKQELNNKRCELLAFLGKVTDVHVTLKKTNDSISSPQEMVINCTREGGVYKHRRKFLQKLDETNLHNLRTIEMEDVEYINLLTQRLFLREPGTVLQCKSVPGLEGFNEDLKKSVLRVDRIMNAVKNHISSSDQWTNLIDGYNKEYASLSNEVENQVVLHECRQNYQIEILMEFLSKCQELCLRLSEELQHAKIVKAEYEDSLAEKDSKITILSEELHDLNAQNKNLQKKICDLEKNYEESLAVNDMKVTDLSEELHDLNTQNKNLQKEISDLKKNYEESLALSEELHNLNAQNQNWLKEICDLTKNFRESSTVNDPLATALQEDPFINQLLVLNAIKQLVEEKDGLLKEQVILKETIQEHTARLMEAAEIYRKQFLEIEKLKKKLQKVKLRSKISSVTSEEIPEVISEDDSKTSTPQELRPLRNNSSDSDTGEHVLQSAAIHPLDGTIPGKTIISGDPNNFLPVKETTSCSSSYAKGENTHSISSCSEPLAKSGSKMAVFDDCFMHYERKDLLEKCNVPSIAKIALTRCGQQQTPMEPSSVSKVFKSSMSDQESWEKFIPKKPSGIKSTTQSDKHVQDSSDDEEFFTIPCILCNKNFMISSKSTSPLLDHLEQQHQLNMCPICGQLFEASFPKIYIMYHINDHFKPK